MNIVDWLSPQLRVFLTPEVFAVLTAISVGTLVVSTLLALIFATQIPDDYFLEHQTSAMERLRQRGFIVWLLVLILRQLLGLLLFMFGLATLVLPGQGLLTLFAALCVLEYPGKRTIIHRLVSQRHIQRALNGLRRRAGKSPLRF